VPAEFPVFIIGTNTTDADRGTGFISLVHVAGQFQAWTGENAKASSSATPSLTGGVAGAVVPTNMLFFDPSQVVSLQSAGPDSFVVANAGIGTATGFIWILSPPAIG
jgi:hypothetical protein